jgi:hypothetical protein
MTNGKRRLTREEREAIERDWRSTNAIRESRRHAVRASKFIEELHLLHQSTADDRFRAALVAVSELDLVKADGHFRRLGPKRVASPNVVRVILSEHLEVYEWTSALILTARDCMVDAATLDAAITQVSRLYEDRPTKSDHQKSDGPT